jgi:hypothetical protein
MLDTMSDDNSGHHQCFCFALVVSSDYLTSHLHGPQRGTRAEGGLGKSELQLKFKSQNPGCWAFSRPVLENSTTCERAIIPPSCPSNSASFVLPQVFPLYFSMVSALGSTPAFDVVLDEDYMQ